VENALLIGCGNFSALNDLKKNLQVDLLVLI
jgi:hypothetical protein